MSQVHTREYRYNKIAEMRSRRLYSGFLHYGFTVGFALLIGFYSFKKIENPNPILFVLVPIMIIYANFIEYFTHRYLLHTRVKGLQILYQRHAVQHHTYFTEHDISIKCHQEMFYVLFPAIAIVIFIPLLAGPLSLLIALYLGENAGWISLATAVFYFAWYETFHLSNHLPRTHLVHRIPGISRMCEYHRSHHAPSNSKKFNFNVTFPLADYLMGTLKR